ncbi:MAG: helix-turn-helix domain-containing protein [Patescibacteria group bacterium]|jgi:transcriptional regulator with XRE-family HTH domain
MKSINNKKTNIDPVAEARKEKHFARYYTEAKERIRLGVEIYNTREKLKISQQELARKAGTTQKVISKIENGDVNIGFSLLNRIANSLGFSYKNWSRVFDFNVPYEFIFIGNSKTIQHTTKIKVNITPLKVLY